MEPWNKLASIPAVLDRETRLELLHELKYQLKRQKPDETDAIYSRVRKDIEELIQIMEGWE